MISKYEKTIVNRLLDKYERSKSFLGQNKVNQIFSVKISTLFPKYIDHSNYEVFSEVNEAISVLVRKSFIYAKSNAANVYSSVALNLDVLEELYAYSGRTPKKDTNSAVLSLLESYKGENEILNKYCQEQYARIRSNRSVQFFSNDIEELENILIAANELLKVNCETFVRDFSIRVFKDTKVFERIAAKTVNLLYEYGEFPTKERLLGELNIVRNPTYINFKGSGSITLEGQLIDLTKLSGDIAISSSMLSSIDKISVIGNAVITIENLTSYHTFNDKDMFAIYLGGYHNSIRREFIRKIHQQNLNIDFYHFGDIDAGGFYILEHLRKKTGVAFKPYKMDVETLKRHSKYTKSLTDNDINRLRSLINSKYDSVIRYMLENNCKLEQEAIGLE